MSSFNFIYKAQYSIFFALQYMTSLCPRTVTVDKEELPKTTFNGGRNTIYQYITVYHNIFANDPKIVWYWLNIITQPSQKINIYNIPYIVLTFLNKLDKDHFTTLWGAAVVNNHTTEDHSLSHSRLHFWKPTSLNQGDERKTRSCPYKQVVWLHLSKCVRTLKLSVSVKSPSPCVTTTLEKRWTGLVVSLCSAVAIVTRAACSAPVKLCLGCRQLGDVCPHPHYCSVCACMLCVGACVFVWVGAWGRM